MSKKVYLAGRYKMKPHLAAIGDLLKQDGHEITSSWIYGSEEGLTKKQIAQLDYDDLMAADYCISATEPHGSYNVAGARHVEFGLAYEAGLNCWIVGEPEVIFHHLNGVCQFNDWSEVRKALND